ncbi:MAG TPA: efflux RND transporter permease subunit, partial [Dongiaceae bacterium]|nr:efflux RND transporter permease subunit [Dongiaceae bacterium]
MSVVGTFSVMYLLGFSLDNLSLMALTLAVGFGGDDAIVMLENIVRHQEMGEDRMAAALRGSKQIGFTILSMTLSLVAVFIPVLFMGGLLGRLFHEFAVTISAAILVSGVVSLTLTPMLCSRFLHHEHAEQHGAVYRSSERLFQKALNGYIRSLAWVIERRFATLIGSFVLLAATVVLFMIVPKGFLPSDDNSQIFGTTETVEGTSFESMMLHQKALAALLLNNPAIDGFMSSIGGSSTSNQGRVFLHLKPRSERPPVDEVIRQLQPKLSQIPGIRVFLQNPPSVRVGGRLTKSLYQFTLQGTDIGALYDASRALEDKLKTVPELANVTSDLQIKNPQVNVAIDRERASALGVTAGQIEDALYDAYGSRQVSTIYTPNNQYWVILEVMPQFQRDAAALRDLRVRSSSGTLVPIGSVATLTEGLGPLTVNHAGQLPAVTISFDLAPGVALGDAVGEVDKIARATLPASITTSFAGNAQVFQSSQKGLLGLLLVAILIIYLVLGMLYESFVHPLTILSGLPSAGFGALLTLLLFRTELGVYGFVGIILLIGLVKKNAIMMIDFALEAERREGKDATSAILEACRVRFRPIMMTTMAALMATLPIALGAGAGAESRRPLGLAVVGGLAFSQFVTLYITPVVYTYLDQFQKRIRRQRTPAVVRTPEPAVAEL